jgi:hypothetical protein
MQHQIATPPEPKETRLVRAQVIADRYDVTDRCVFLWKDQGRIPFIKIGKTIRFDLAKVIETLEGAAAGKEGA